MALACLFGAAPAIAQTYGVGVSASTPNLGNVASAASGGNTVFRIAPSTGTVTKLSGNGGRISSGTTRATVTVSCGNQSACNSTQVNVRVGQAGSPTKRAAALTNFTVSAGSATITVAPTGTSTINFRISAIGQNTSKTFFLGADFPIEDDTGGATGQSDSAFYVWVAASPSTPTGSVSGSGTATANVFRSLSLAQTSALSFGRLVRPLTGSGWVNLAASNGARTSSAAFWMTLPSPTRAAYTASGEGGKVLAIDVPATFTMTRVGGGGSVTVTTDDTVATTPTLSSIPGSGGTYSFYVGGKLDLSSSTPGGAYSGTYTVTVSYN